MSFRRSCMSCLLGENEGVPNCTVMPLIVTSRRVRRPRRRCTCSMPCSPRARSGAYTSHTPPVPPLARFAARSGRGSTVGRYRQVLQNRHVKILSCCDFLIVFFSRSLSVVSIIYHRVNIGHLMSYVDTTYFDSQVSPWHSKFAIQRLVFVAFSPPRKLGCPFLARLDTLGRCATGR